MMWVIAAILLLSSETKGCRNNLTLTASKSYVVFETPNYPRRHSADEFCLWHVSAPGDATQLTISCFVDIVETPNCYMASFSFYDYDDKIPLCGRQHILRTLNGSTNLFEFESSMCFNHKYRGVSCKVYYTPDENPTITIRVNPNCSCGEKGQPRIIGGNKAADNELPWQAMLRNMTSTLPFCGGSVIAKQWVLTAVHCVNNISASSILVVLGEHNYEEHNVLKQFFDVTEIIKHENYWQITEANNDIALLKLATLVEFDEVITPICLPFNYKYYDFTDEIGIATGWGITCPGNVDSGSEVLKKIAQKIIMPSKCTWLDGYVWYKRAITENMICAVAQNGCPSEGDSGGPLVWESDSSGLYFQLGITSFWHTRLTHLEPIGYARVSQFLNWIVTKTGAGDEFCLKI